jgi:hypothetical protein
VILAEPASYDRFITPYFMPLTSEHDFFSSINPRIMAMKFRYNSLEAARESSFCFATGLNFI